MLEIAHVHEGVNLAQLDAHDGNDALDLVMVHVSNKKVKSLVGQLKKIPNMRLTLLPSAVMALYPPPTLPPTRFWRCMPPLCGSGHEYRHRQSPRAMAMAMARSLPSHWE